jgi:hypothetical protein
MAADSSNTSTDAANTASSQTGTPVESTPSEHTADLASTETGRPPAPPPESAITDRMSRAEHRAELANAIEAGNTQNNGHHTADGDPDTTSKAERTADPASDAANRRAAGPEGNGVDGMSRAEYRAALAKAIEGGHEQYGDHHPAADSPDTTSKAEHTTDPASSQTDRPPTPSREGVTADGKSWAEGADTEKARQASRDQASDSGDQPPAKVARPPAPDAKDLDNDGAPQAANIGAPEASQDRATAARETTAQRAANAREATQQRAAAAREASQDRAATAREATASGPDGPAGPPPPGGPDGSDDPGPSSVEKAHAKNDPIDLVEVAKEIVKTDEGEAAVGEALSKAAEATDGTLGEIFSETPLSLVAHVHDVVKNGGIQYGADTAKSAASAAAIYLGEQEQAVVEPITPPYAVISEPFASEPAAKINLADGVTVETSAMNAERGETATGDPLGLADTASKIDDTSITVERFTSNSGDLDFSDYTGP